MFHCDNNVVDHQVINMNMTDGTTMSFTMCGFTYETSRYAKFMGTKGELIVDMQPDEKESKIWIEHFDPERTKEIINVAELSEDFSDTAVEITGWWKNFWIFISGGEIGKYLYYFAGQIVAKSLLCTGGGILQIA